MSIGVEQTFINKLVTKHSEDLTAELINQLFINLTGDELTLQITEQTETRVTALLSSKKRNFQAVEQQWNSANLATLVMDAYRFYGDEETYLNTDTHLIHVDEVNNIIYVPYSEFSVVDDAYVIRVLGEYTGYDFSDIGTIHGMHLALLEDKTEVSLPDTNPFKPRIEKVWTVVGGLLQGTACFIKDDFYTFSEDIDLGQILV